MPLALWILLATLPDLLVPHGEKALVLVFVRSDCPISNRYAPELERLYERYHPLGFDFRLVYPEPDLEIAAMERHRRAYGYAIPGLLDPGRRLAARARVRVTPEAVVWVRGQLVYLGRIDDRFVAVGKSRQAATRHDLEDVLRAVLAGTAVAFRQTEAIGCAIEGLP